MRHLNLAILGFLLLGCWGLETSHADTDGDTWLRYAPLPSAVRAKYESLPANLVVLGDSAVLRSAQSQMIQGVKGMAGKSLIDERVTGGKSVPGRAIILGTLAEIHVAAPELAPSRPLGSDGFWLVTARVRGFDCLIVTSPSDRGVLYGVFALLSKVARGENGPPSGLPRRGSALR
jgi:alpha-glucuronidase